MDSYDNVRVKLSKKDGHRGLKKKKKSKHSKENIGSNHRGEQHRSSVGFKHPKKSHAFAPHQPRQQVLLETPQTKPKAKRKRTPQRQDTPKSTRKKQRARPGTRALKEIRQFQRSTDLLIRKLPFARVVREETQR